jgi:hypothetical protein
MACILWDAASIETINKLTRAFLWKNKKDIHGGHCLLAWDIVTLPKEQGGLELETWLSITKPSWQTWQPSCCQVGLVHIFSGWSIFSVAVKMVPPESNP